MTGMDLSRIDHERLREEVRIRLAHRYEKLLNAMEVFLDDDPREFSAAQLAIYLQTARNLGDLYQVRDRPRDTEEFLTLEQAERLAESRAVEAAEAARVEERQRLEGARMLELEGAGRSLRERLGRLRDRTEGQGSA